MEVEMPEVDLARMRRALVKAADVFEAEKDRLGALDAAVGDGDHGASMARGFRAVAERLATDASEDVGALWQVVGTTLVSVIGGATGPLFGTFFLRGGEVVAGKAATSAEDLASMFEGGLAGVRALGGAAVGDKTMVDALTPAALALRGASAGDPIEALRAAAEAAERGAVATREMVARKGRARYQGERSLGHQDAGATSVSLLVRVLAEEMRRPERGG